MAERKPQNVKLEDVIREAVRSRLALVHTSAPGVVQSYDRSNQSASVQLVVRGRRIDQRTGEVTTYIHRPLVNVPVVFPGGGGASLTFDLQAGDPVVVLFAERDISQWLQTGTTDATPVDPRRHALGDAVCIPQVSPFSGAVRPPDATLEGATVLYAEDIRLGSALADDFIALASLVEARFAEIHGWMDTMKQRFDTHIHGGVTVGVGATASAIPIAPGPADILDPVGSAKVRSE